MKHFNRFLTLMAAAALLTLAASSCSTSQTLAAGDPQQREVKQKTKSSQGLWHLFGKRQKAYVFSCRKGEALRYCYSYDGLIWSELTDAQGLPVTGIEASAFIKSSQTLKKVPQQVAGTLEEGTVPQVMKIGKYSYIYWNKAIVRRIGCLRTSGSVNNEQKLEEIGNYIKFPAGIRLEELHEIRPKTLQQIQGI